MYETKFSIWNSATNRYLLDDDEDFIVFDTRGQAREMCRAINRVTGSTDIQPVAIIISAIDKEP